MISEGILNSRTRRRNGRHFLRLGSFLTWKNKIQSFYMTLRGFYTLILKFKKLKNYSSGFSGRCDYSVSLSNVISVEVRSQKKNIL